MMRARAASLSLPVPLADSEIARPAQLVGPVSCAATSRGPSVDVPASVGAPPVPAPPLVPAAPAVPLAPAPLAPVPAAPVPAAPGVPAVAPASSSQRRRPLSLPPWRPPCAIAPDAARRRYELHAAPCPSTPTAAPPSEPRTASRWVEHTPSVTAGPVPRGAANVVTRVRLAASGRSRSRARCVRQAFGDASSAAAAQ